MKRKKYRRRVNIALTDQQQAILNDLNRLPDGERLKLEAEIVCTIRDRSSAAFSDLMTPQWNAGYLKGFFAWRM